MAEASRTVCDIIYLFNDYAGKYVLQEGIDRACNNLHIAMEREVATMAYNEVAGLLQ